MEKPGDEAFQASFEFRGGDTIKELPISIDFRT